MTFSVVLCINYADTPRDAENHVYIYIYINVYTVMQHDLVKAREDRGMRDTSRFLF